MVRLFPAGVAVFIALMVCDTARGEKVGKPIISGQEEYLWNCAACHGEDGTGDGPLAAVLIRKPTDLTKIASRNGGVFPAEAVFETIAGRKDVPGHQTFQMPRYWNRFSKTEGQFGYDPAQVRINAIVEYLETVQKP